MSKFLGKYKVGQESFQDDIPQPVLYEIIFHAAVVLKKCILATFPESKRKKVESNWLYLLGLHYPIQFFHFFTRFLRRAPELSKILVSVSLAVSVVLITLGINFRKHLLFTEEKDLSLTGVTLFLLIPIGALAGLYFLLCTYRVTQPGRGINWFSVFKISAVSLAVIALIAFLGLPVAVAFGVVKLEALNQLTAAGWIPGWQGYLVRLANNPLDYWFGVIPFLLAAAASWLIRPNSAAKPTSKGDLHTAIVSYIPTQALAELGADLGVAVPAPAPTGAFTIKQREQLANSILKLDPEEVRRKIRQYYPGALPW
ncbi:MAG: hypothetical protein JJE04_27790 [Acidobacteriia bacterium]|nr:hypothetical protein [Terriglobia bacterium]